MIFGDALRIERVGLLGRLLGHLDAGVGVELVGLRVEVLRLERRHDLLGGRVVARLGAEGISVPSTPGPPIWANSESVMPSPEIMTV